MPPPCSTSEIDSSLNSLINTIKNAEVISVPKRTYYPNSITLPYNIKALIAQRNYTRRQWQRNRCPITNKTLKSLTKSINQKIFEYKNKQFSKKLEKLEPASKNFWKITKIIKNKHNNIPPLINPVTNVVIGTNKGKAQEIAKRFHKAHFTTTNFHDQETELVVLESIQKLDTTPISVDQTHNYLTTPIEIKEILMKLKNRKSPGPDLVANKILKALSKRCVVLYI